MKEPKLYQLVENFIFDSYSLIDPVLEKKWIKPQFDKYPVVSHDSSGMPKLINSNYDSPPNISKLFKEWNGKSDIDLKSIDSYKILNKYLSDHKEYRSSLLPKDLDKETSDEVFKTLGPIIIEDLLERYYLLNHSKEKNIPLLKSIYLQFENYIFAETLYFDISLPILFLRFTETEYTIDENVSIRKISDEYHKARFNIRSYSPPISDPIISSATHELVLKGFSVKKVSRYFTSSSLDSESAYPLTKFELFFNAIKIVSNHNSGFAQILIHPHEWADFFNMDLPLLKGISVKRYPNYFDNFYWNNNSFPIIALEELQEISTIFQNLLSNENNKIQIANRRLRFSYLRDNEEDSILDIIIALETLLSDNEKGEITHKLALRIAKLLSVYTNTYKPRDVFNAVKKIYKFRSDIVHGSNKIDLKQEIQLHEESKPIRTISLANDYLREIIKIVIENPKYSDPKEIDMLLLE